MSHPNSTNRSFINLALLSLLLIANFIFTPYASAAVKFPKCVPILQWAAVSYEQDKNIKSINYWGGKYAGRKYNGKYLLTGFMDKMLKPVFGKTYDQWTDADIKKFSKISSSCVISYRKAAREARKKRNYKFLEVYGAAQSYLYTVLGAGKSTPIRADSYFSMIMTHQRKVYKEHKKALALKTAQLAKAKTMKATKANIQQLTVMAGNPQFIYLRPRDKKNHGIMLQNHRIRLADQIVVNAAEKFSSFPETLEGLTKLQAYSKQLQTDLRGIRSSKWKEFEQAYKARTFAIAAKAVDGAIARLKKFPATYAGLKNLNAYQQEIQGIMGQIRSKSWPTFLEAYSKIIRSNALTAIDDYKKELNALPATTANLKLVKTSVQNLFKLRNPKNMKAYQAIAKERTRTMKQDIRKIACYKKLDNVGLEKKARDVALLGHNGETTLGLFVCAIGKRGHKFQEYESAGMFGSTHKLGILSNRGITLIIEMKKVEAVKGKKMLVGTLIKDASSETKLSLTGWQDNAAKLTGKRYRR